MQEIASSSKITTARESEFLTISLGIFTRKEVKGILWVREIAQGLKIESTLDR